MRIFPILVLIFLGCRPASQQRNNQTLNYDTIHFGSYYGTDFWENIASLNLLNQGSSSFILKNNSLDTVTVDIGLLTELDPELVSTNPNVVIKKLDRNIFELNVNRSVKEKDGFDARLALINTFRESGYIILKRDTTSSSAIYRDFELFKRIDTVMRYGLKIK